MSLPDLLDEALDGEPAVAQVPLGGEDVLVVTPTQTLVYRADGLLSDESIERYNHDAERISLSVGRRKAKLTLEYGLDGSETLALPAKRVEKALHPILAGVINAAGITDPGETVLKTFRFSELTLIVTSLRVVKHIGSAVWATDFESFGYDNLTDVSFEEGSVATAVVLTHNGRQDRFKAPNSDARAVREAIVEAVCAYHEVNSIEELRVRMAEQAADEPAGEEVDRLDFGDGPDPLSAEPAELSDTPANATQTTVVDDAETAADETVGDKTLAASLGEPAADTTGTSPPAEADIPAPANETAESSSEAASDPADSPTPDPATETVAEAATEPVDAFEGSPFESAGPVDEDDLAHQLAVLTKTVERQETQLSRQAELLETLIEELRRGR